MKCIEYREYRGKNNIIIKTYYRGDNTINILPHIPRMTSVQTVNQQCNFAQLFLRFIRARFLSSLRVKWYRAMS
jgi:hypothetical protein